MLDGQLIPAIVLQVLMLKARLRKKEPNGT